MPLLILIKHPWRDVLQQAHLRRPCAPYCLSCLKRIGILRLVKRFFVDTSVLLRWYYAFVLTILEYCSPLWGFAVECHLQLIERQVCSVARLCLQKSFLSLCYRRHVAAGVCCTRLIRTRIIVCSVRLHMLQSEFDILELQLQLIDWSLKYQGVERHDLQGVSCRPRVVCGMTSHTLFWTPER